MGQQTSTNEKVKREKAIEALFIESSHPWDGRTCDCCDVCGDGDPNLCKCARERFMNKLTDSDIDMYLNRDVNWKTNRTQDIEKIWDKRCEHINKFSSMLCKKCKVNLLTCECAKKSFIKHLSYGEFEYITK